MKYNCVGWYYTDQPWSEFALSWSLTQLSDEKWNAGKNLPNSEQETCFRSRILYWSSGELPSSLYKKMEWVIKARPRNGVGKVKGDTKYPFLGPNATRTFPLGSSVRPADCDNTDTTTLLGICQETGQLPVFWATKWKALPPLSPAITSTT